VVPIKTLVSRSIEFGLSVEYFCVVPLVCFHNILITINFDILKYIKKIFKISIQYIFNAQQRTTPEKSIENLNSVQFHPFYMCIIFKKKI